MIQFLSNLLGEMTFVQFINSLFFALLGVIASLLMNALQRNKESERTPTKFKFSFLLLDNIERIILNIIIISVSILIWKDFTHTDIKNGYAFLLGMNFDRIAEALKSVKIIDKFTPRFEDDKKIEEKEENIDDNKNIK